MRQLVKQYLQMRNMTYAEIARVLGISRERVRQIANQEKLGPPAPRKVKVLKKIPVKSLIPFFVEYADQIEKLRKKFVIINKKKIVFTRISTIKRNGVVYYVFRKPTKYDICIHYGYPTPDDYYILPSSILKNKERLYIPDLHVLRMYHQRVDFLHKEVFGG